MKAISFLFLIAPACGMAHPEVDASGMYEMIVCKKSCSFENPQAAIARGMVVLFESRLLPADAKRLDPFHFGAPNEMVRACFTGVQSKNAETFAFAEKTGTTSWSLKGKELSFSLMRSVDAGYAVDVELKGDIFSGKGVSWGAGVADPAYSPDLIVGRRVGPADIAACRKGITPPAA